MPSRSSSLGSASSARSERAAPGQLRRCPAPPEATLCERARQLLNERFGPATQAPVTEGVARGATGLLGEHTHYSDGFAVLMPFAQGTAVAARPASLEASRLAFEGGKTYELRTDLLSEQPTEVRAAAAVIRALASTPVEAAVVSAVPSVCFDARLAALGGAVACAVNERARVSTSSDPQSGYDDVWEDVRTALDEGAGVPFSRAYVMAAVLQASPEHSSSRQDAEDTSAGAPSAFSEGQPPWVLADTATREYLPVEVPPAEELERGLIAVQDGYEVGEILVRPPAFHRERRQQAEEALRVLREAGFEGLTAFRDLEHRDLDRALRLLPTRLQSVARHLITQNRRVPKLIRAVRKRDWQFFGALLLMSHLSHEDDWQTTGAPLDAIVSAAEDTDVEGLYGACMTGRGPCALVVGRPSALPSFFQRATRLLAEEFDLAAETMLL